MHSNDDKFKNVKSAFDNILFSDIDKAIGAGADFISFIVLCCAIDIAAKYYKGTVDSRAENFKAFVNDYMRRYAGLDLWKELRNPSAHSLALGKTLILGNKNTKSGYQHLQTTSKGASVLLVEDFSKDVKDAIHAYLSDLETEKQGTDPSLWRTFESAYNQDNSIGFTLVDTTYNSYIVVNVPDTQLTSFTM